MSTSQVDSVLKGIASSKIKNEIDGSYSDIGDVMKEVGGVSNNILLKHIQSESKRTADELVRMNGRIGALELSLNSIAGSISTLCDLVRTQNELLASGSLMSPIEGSPIEGRASPGSDWYYRGTKLSTKYHVYACVFLHLIDMAQLHMDIMGKQYPDSIDADLNTMQNAVRVVSGVRCNIVTVEYKNIIDTKEKSSQSFGLLYPKIATSKKGGTATLLESSLADISSPVTRDAMQDLEWIRQRLPHLDGILSVKQMDILKSIGFPLIKPGTVDELNWNPVVVKPRTSHPLIREIMSLKKVKGDKYMIEKMRGKNTQAAYNIAKDFTGTKAI